MDVSGMSEMVDRLARASFEGYRPMTGAGSDASWDKLGELAKDAWRHDARRMVETFSDALSGALNSYLIEMKPNMDDSITGFNEAWDVMRKVLK